MPVGVRDLVISPAFCVCQDSYPVPSQPLETAQDGVTPAVDDLSVFLQQILKYNTLVAQRRNAGASSVTEANTINLLQFYCDTYMDNERIQPSAINKSKRTLKGIRERLRTKFGRVRQNLMGKRVDFSARTVITADPFLDLDQVVHMLWWGMGVG